MNAGGQTIADRINAARYGLAGHMLAKAVCKATTEEQLGPKKKHLDYLLHCTEEPNISIPQLANLLLDRLQHLNWVVVFKALVTIHHLMLYGNERFIQYLASANSSFSLNAFLDNKSGVQGYDMSTYIRRYSKYLNQKALSYRLVAFDFCKVKRGKDDGVLRKMAAEKLLKTLPVIQDQMDALLEFDCSPNELTNAVISSCFVLLFRDLIRLFACYNDGIINMLEKYFDMNKKMCRDALEIYKKFLIRMDKVASFLKVAENVGIPKGEIPDLTRAPASLLDALEQHLDALEGNKKPSPSGVTGSGSIHAGLMTLSQTEHSLNEVDEKERQRAILEEQQAMEEIKRKREQQAALEQQNSFAGASSELPKFSSLPKAPSAASTPVTSLPPPTSTSHHTAQSQKPAAPKNDLLDLFDLDMNAGATNGTANAAQKPDPFAAVAALNAATASNAMQHQSSFQAGPQAMYGVGSPGAAVSGNPFGSPTSGFVPVAPGVGMMNPFAMSPTGAYPPAAAMQYNGGVARAANPFGQPQGGAFDPDFGSAFGAAPMQQQPATGFYGGAVPMKPPSSNTSASAAQAKLIQSNVDTSLANLAANLNLGTMGSYGVRPPTVTQSAFPGGIPGGSVFSAQSAAQPPKSFNSPMAANATMGGQFQGPVNGASAAWNPFMSPTSAAQQSPTRHQQPIPSSGGNDPFGSLI